MKKGGRYLVGCGGRPGPVSLGSTDNENVAVSRAAKVASAAGPSGFSTIVDRYKGIAWRLKTRPDGKIARRGIKLPDGITGVLIGANLGSDLPEPEARRRILASMRRKGGGASVMGPRDPRRDELHPWTHGIPLSYVLAPRYVVTLRLPDGSGYIPLCSSRKSLPAVQLARQIASGAAGSKLSTIVADRRSMQAWSFAPDAKGRVLATGPGLGGMPGASIGGPLGQAAAAGATGGAAAGAAAAAMTALIGLIQRAFASKKPSDAKKAADFAERNDKPKTAAALNQTAKKFESESRSDELPSDSDSDRRDETSGWHEGVPHTISEELLTKLCRSNKGCNGHGLMEPWVHGGRRVYEVRWNPLTPIPPMPDTVMMDGKPYPIMVRIAPPASAYTQPGMET